MSKIFRGSRSKEFISRKGGKKRSLEEYEEEEGEGMRQRGR